jgi:DNA-binding response OmpR family regulator
LDAWRTPGCGERCFRNRHDPFAHEAYGMLQGMIGHAVPLHIVRSGALSVDLVACAATVDGAIVRLSGLEMGTLLYLANRVGGWCHMDDILTDVWGPGYAVLGRHLFRVRMAALRKKLGTTGYLIENGYPSRERHYRLTMEPTA